MKGGSDAREAELAARKAALRTRMLARRRALPDRPALSRRIRQRLVALPEYAAARRLALYVSHGAEVETRELIERAWGEAKTVAVPYCQGDDLVFYVVTRWDELAPGVLGVPAPAEAVRSRSERLAEPSGLDLVVAPGLAFDRQGGRLGRGRGYYDRFLASLPPSIPKAGLAFEAQLVGQVPCGPRDAALDLIVTESAVYRR